MSPPPAEPSTAGPTAASAPPPSELRALLALAWPIVLARATQAVIGFTDALFVAPLGEAPLAAATTGAIDAFAFIMFPMGTAFIVQSFAAQLRGRGDTDAVERYAWYGLALALGAGLLALAALPLLPGVVGRLGYAPAVTVQMVTYLQLRLLSVAPAVGIEALGNWYGGLGNTRPSMVAGVVAMIANVAGCYLLISPRLGLPGYGVAGSALASAVATWLGFAVIFGGFLHERRGKPGPWALGLRANELWRVLRFGAPNGVNWFLEFAAFALFINVVVGHLGTTALAAFNVVMQLNSVAFMPAFGLASAGAILVGEAIGRGAHDEVGRTVRRTAMVACGWMGAVGAVYFGLAPWLMRWFEPEAAAGSAFVTVGAQMLALAALWQLFDALGMTFGEALRAAGDTAWSMAARIVLAWVFFTPLAWAAVLWLHGGVRTVMGALIAYMGALAVTMGLRFASGRWRGIDLVGTVSSSQPGEA